MIIRAATVTEYLHHCRKFFQGLFIYIHKDGVYMGVTDSCRFKEKMEINIVLQNGTFLFLIDTWQE